MAAFAGEEKGRTGSIGGSKRQERRVSRVSLAR
jgi:hypothetical protein